MKLSAQSRQQGKTLKSNIILRGMARNCFEDYGAECYEAFCKKNQLARVPSIERKISGCELVGEVPADTRLTSFGGVVVGCSPSSPPFTIEQDDEFKTQMRQMNGD